MTSAMRLIVLVCLCVFSLSKCRQPAVQKKESTEALNLDSSAGKQNPQKWIGLEFKDWSDIDTTMAALEIGGDDAFGINIMSHKNRVYEDSTWVNYIIVTKKTGQQTWKIKDIKSVQLRKNQSVSSQCQQVTGSNYRTTPTLVTLNANQYISEIVSAWLPDIQTGKLQKIPIDQVTCPNHDEEEREDDASE